jgi:hypothetical protein
MFLSMLKSGERERLKWRKKKMRDISIGKRERETWNESGRLGEKKESVERERKKKRREGEGNI